MKNLNPMFDALLAPLDGANPAGANLRYGEAWQRIEEARRQDIDFLPRGIWDKELKAGDFETVKSECTQILSKDSKDFQVAVWLIDAQVRTQGLDGLNDYIDMMTALVEQYWDDGFPEWTVESYEAREGVFFFLDSVLVKSLRSSVLLSDPVCSDEPLRYQDWIDQNKGQLTQTIVPKPGEETERGGLQDQLRGLRLSDLHQKYVRSQFQSIGLVSEAFDSLLNLLSPRLSKDGPSLRKAHEELLALKKLFEALESELPPLELDGSSWPEKVNERCAELQAGTPEDYAGETGAKTLQNKGVDGNANMSNISREAAHMSREEIYKELALMADRLQELEPHSPTPYLLRRAVKWGEMSLSELMDDLQREGDVLRQIIE